MPTPAPAMQTAAGPIGPFDARTEMVFGGPALTGPATARRTIAMAASPKAIASESGAALRRRRLRLQARELSEVEVRRKEMRGADHLDLEVDAGVGIDLALHDTACKADQ